MEDKVPGSKDIAKEEESRECRGVSDSDARGRRGLMNAAWFLGGGLYVLLLNINSSHLSVPMPTMNNRVSTQLCQHFELLIHNHRLALVHTAGALSTVGYRHICLLRLNHMRALAHTCTFTR